MSSELIIVGLALLAVAGWILFFMVLSLRGKELTLLSLNATEILKLRREKRDLEVKLNG